MKARQAVCLLISISEHFYIFGLNINSSLFPCIVKNVPTKRDLQLDITELELAAELVEKEEEEKQKMQVLHTTLSGLHLSDEEESRYE
jgi:hypothetical protein